MRIRSPRFQVFPGRAGGLKIPDVVKKFLQVWSPVFTAALTFCDTINIDGLVKSPSSDRGRVSPGLGCRVKIADSTFYAVNNIEEFVKVEFIMGLSKAGNCNARSFCN